MDFDPFESEEEYVIEESEQLSAIDEAICGQLVDKVIYEGFSDYDSDAFTALDTHNNMLDAVEDLTALSCRQSSSKKQHRSATTSHALVVASKKRKRSGKQADFE